MGRASVWAFAACILVVTSVVSNPAVGEPGIPGNPPVVVAPVCTVGPAVVVDAYKSPSPKEEAKEGGEKAEPARDRYVKLGDVVAIEVKNGDSLFSEACRKKTLVLFLNGHPIKGLKSYPPTDPKAGIWKFTLIRTEASRDTWTALLGKPELGYRKMTASIGFEDQYPLDSEGDTPILNFQVVSGGWVGLWAVIFAAMVIIFFWCARSTSIIRNGGASVDPVTGSRGTFSLSKSQGAWWFFAILAAYLLIGIVTGDFSTSINNTALILLGIGAGTVLGSAAIDASKYTQDQLDNQKTAAIALRSQINELRESISSDERTLASLEAGSELQKVASRLAANRNKLADSLSAYRKLVGVSEGFITDILSDANGINFHRFQIAVWTLVLGIIFIKEVYVNLAMPTFDTTLMGLLGLSAGTYLGLKIPEPIVPASAKTDKR